MKQIIFQGVEPQVTDIPPDQGAPEGSKLVQFVHAEGAEVYVFPLSPRGVTKLRAELSSVEVASDMPPFPPPGERG